jgi:hypothetical protein
MAKLGMLKNVQSRLVTQDSRAVMLTVKDIVSEKQFDSIADDMRQFFINSDTYRLEVTAPDAEREKAAHEKTANS